MAEYIVRIEESEKNMDEHFVGALRLYPELIRCKDCKWFLPSESKNRGWCSFSQHGCPKADDYCSDAERKDE